MGHLSAVRRSACLALAVLSSLAVMGTAAATATASGVTVEVLPKALTPKAGGQRSITLILRNSGLTATNVTLSALRGTTNSEYRLGQAPNAPQPWRLGRLAKGEDRSWEVQVVTPARFLPGRVYFVVRYMAAGKPRIVSAPFDVQGVAETKLEDVAAVEVKSTLDSLDDRHDGYVYLLVTNKSGVDITVAGVRADKPDFVDITAPDQTVIGSRQTQAVALKVTTRKRVRPGEYYLVFHIPISWTEGSDTKSAEVIAAQKTKIGVYAEGEIAKAVGAPLLLFLPGVLMVAAFLLIGIVGRKVGSSFKDITLSGVLFVVIGLSLSLPIAYLVPRLGGPDFIAGYYGFNDLVWLWFLSLAAGVVAGIVWFWVLPWLGKTLKPLVRKGVHE